LTFSRDVATGQRHRQLRKRQQSVSGLVGGEKRRRL